MWAGSATGGVFGLPPAADWMFCVRSQWLFTKTSIVMVAKAFVLGTETMLTVPLSWWVL